MIIGLITESFRLSAIALSDVGRRVLIFQLRMENVVFGFLMQRIVAGIDLD